MAINDLDRFRTHLPEVFRDQVLPPDWDDDWIFVPVEEPDAMLGAELEVLIAETPNETDAFAPFEGPDSPFWIGGPDWTSSVPAWSGVGGFPGAPGGAPLPGGSPPPDALAFYLPFHYFHPEWWGVYLVLEGVRDLALSMHRHAQGRLSVQDCVVAARQFLYSHEAFHHDVEVFALRLETTHRIPLYARGFERAFQSTYGTDNCREEALANAYALRSTRTLNKRTPAAHRVAIDAALRAFVRSSPPGYRVGADLVGQRAYSAARRELAEEYHSAALPIRPAAPDIWQAASYMFNGISRRGSRTNYLVRRGSRLADRLKLQGRYARYRDVRRNLERKGNCRYVRPGKGAHEVWERPDGGRFIISRHPGDLAMGTLRAIIREAGLEMSVSAFLSA